MGIGAEISVIVDQIGFGPWHLKQILLGTGLVWSDGAEILLISVVSNTLKRSLDLDGNFLTKCNKIIDFLMFILYFCRE
tara:strand:- start:680 stop:916 length:237 start_codon:yes stop_codon:yes gene_type:complete